MNSTLLLTAFSGSQQGPTLLGVDVVWASTMLVAVGIFAVMVAIYGALTVRDPMAKRVKALNDRREQLKAGITASTAKRRARLVRKNHTADKMRTFLGKLQVLQDSQIKEVQQKLAQAGIRSKDLAVAVIFGRLVLPIVFGGIAALLIYWVDMWPDLTPFKRSAATMAMLILGYKAPDLFIQNKRQKRTDAIRKGLPDAPHDARRRKGRAPARDHDGTADPVHPAGAVHRHPGPGGLLAQRCDVGRQPRRRQALTNAASQTQQKRGGIIPAPSFLPPARQATVCSIAPKMLWWRSSSIQIRTVSPVCRAA